MRTCGVALQEADAPVRAPHGQLGASPGERQPSPFQIDSCGLAREQFHFGLHFFC